MTNTYDWYNIVGEVEIEQGDIFKEFPVLMYPSDMPTDINDLEDLLIEPEINILNLIVMTQSCDFQKMTDDSLVTFCAISSFPALYDGEKDKGNDKWFKLIDGRIIDAHLMNKCDIPQYEFEYQVVNLGQVFTAPLKYTKRFAKNAGNRVRLMPPYREQLAQAFARRFMRVGLPIDLPRKFPYV